MLVWYLVLVIWDFAPAAPLRGCLIARAQLVPTRFSSDAAAAEMDDACDFTLPSGGSETSVSEVPGRVVGIPIELPSALPEGSFLAFDPPRGRVKSVVVALSYRRPLLATCDSSGYR